MAVAMVETQALDASIAGAAAEIALVEWGAHVVGGTISIRWAAEN
jgi:hypothetical protein